MLEWVDETVATAGRFDLEATLLARSAGSSQAQATQEDGRESQHQRRSTPNDPIAAPGATVRHSQNQTAVDGREDSGRHAAASSSRW